MVLVRKCYTKKGKGERAFQLRTLETQRDDSAYEGGKGGREKDKDQHAMEQDYEEFLDQLEADKEMRGRVNLYKASSSTSTDKQLGVGGKGGGGGGDFSEPSLARSRAAMNKDRKEHRKERKLTRYLTN